MPGITLSNESRVGKTNDVSIVMLVVNARKLEKEGSLVNNDRWFSKVSEDVS